MTITLIDLRAEAEDEARRVSCARALIQPGDEDALAQLEGDAAWIALPRRPGVRRALAGQICLVWRVAFDDRSGRVVETRLVPILARVDRSIVQLARRRSSRVWPLLRAAEEAVRTQAETACDGWALATGQTRHAFAAARLAREEAIARLPQRPHVPSQPGLFDRRGERAAHAQAAIADGAEEAANDRMRSIGDSRAITRQPAQLMLVLVP